MSSWGEETFSPMVCCLSKVAETSEGIVSFPNRKRLQAVHNSVSEHNSYFFFWCSYLTDLHRYICRFWHDHWLFWRRGSSWFSRVTYVLVLAWIKVLTKLCFCIIDLLDCCFVVFCDCLVERQDATSDKVCSTVLCSSKQMPYKTYQ